MASTYSNLKIQLMATGENSATWGNVTNTNLGTAIEEAITGSASVAFSSANVTLSLSDTNTSQTARNLRLNLTGTATAGYNLVVPSIQKAYIVNNGTDGTITVKNATGTGIAVPAGKTTWVFNNGTNVVDVVTHLTSLTLASALPVASGGTGGNTAATARTALSAAQSGTNVDITSLQPMAYIIESATVSATAATGTINFDAITQSVVYYTTNASGNWTFNIRGNSGTTLNTLLSTGQAITVAFLATNGSTAYYNNVVQVDGTTSGVTTKWQGAAPSGGNASGIDVYTYTVIKTASATFTVLASQTKFA
jgi:hypothetical protein